MNEKPPEQQAERGERQRELLQGIWGPLQLREPPSFPEWFGYLLASRLLWFILGLTVAFLIAWWWTRPTLDQVQNLLGTSANPKDVLETLNSLQRDHFDQFSRIFQLAVLSVLVPLFTLLAGYAFGSRQREKGEER